MNQYFNRDNMVLFWRSYFKTNPVENRIENRILKQVQYKQHLFIHLQGGQIIGRNEENSPKTQKIAPGQHQTKIRPGDGPTHFWNRHPNSGNQIQNDFKPSFKP